MSSSNATSAAAAAAGGANANVGSGSGSISSNASNSSERLLAGILESFPAWDLNVGLLPNVGQANG